MLSSNTVKTLATGLAVLVAVGGVHLVRAQNASTDAEAVLPTEARANLTPAEMVEEAERTQTGATQLSSRVSSMLDEARRDQDIIRVTCLNDKLTQVNANGRTLDQRVTNLQDAVASSDAGRANHEYTVIVVIGQKLAVLDREAQQCIGQDVFETGATLVEMTVPSDTPGEEVVYVWDAPADPFPFMPPPNSGTM